LVNQSLPVPRFFADAGVQPAIVGLCSWPAIDLAAVEKDVRRGCKAEAAQSGIQDESGDAPLWGERTLAELSVEFGVHSAMISGWKQELGEARGELFARGSKVPAVEDAQRVLDDLHRKIGQLQVERDFLAGQPAISRLLVGGR
jgi:hypothetical protein